LKKYDSVLDILQEFFDLRMKFYKKRRDYMLGLLEAEAERLKAMARFIVEKCDKTLVIENKKKKQILEELVSRKYPPDPVLRWQSAQAKLNLEEEEEETRKDKNDEEDDPQTKNYNYLMKMSMWKLTLEQKEQLLKERDEKIKELEDLRMKTPSDLYRDDLDEFMEKLDKVEAEEQDEDKSKSSDKKAFVSKKGTVRKALAEYAPSPKGERVAPRIEEMLKKS